MDIVGGTLKHVIFQKVKSGQAAVYTPDDFTNSTKVFVLLIITVYFLEAEEIDEPINREDSPLVKAKPSVHKLKDLSLKETSALSDISTRPRISTHFVRSGIAKVVD